MNNLSAPLAAIIVLLGLPACSAGPKRTGGVTPTEACRTRGALIVHITANAPASRCLTRGAVESHGESPQEAFEALQQNAAEAGANFVQVARRTQGIEGGGAGPVTLYGAAFRCPHETVARNLAQGSGRVAR